MTLGERVRARREELKLSREKLSQQTGIMVLTLLRIENNRVKDPRMRTLIKLSRALDMTIGELVDEAT